MLHQEVDFEPAYPKDGEPGSSLVLARQSERWPGLYFGRCPHCDAYLIAAKRAPRCDDCEDRRLAALGRMAPSTEADAVRARTDAERIADLTKALTDLVSRYVQVAAYAYGALYSPEAEPVVIQARKILTEARR